MMLMSVAHKLFDFVLGKLNENDKGVTFDGTFTFRFWQQPTAKIQDFHIATENPDILEDDAKPVVPFVDVSNVEIPFNEKNKRQDFEVEYYISIKTDVTFDKKGYPIIQFDYTNDRYQALMQAYEDLKTNLTYTDASMRVGFKAREPQKVNVFKYNGHYYQIFALTLNISKIEKGRFGNEMELSIARVGQTLQALDTTETRVTMGKTERERTLTTQKNRNISIINRVWECQTTINYLGEDIDKEILNEVMMANLSASNSQIVYELRMIQVGDFDVTYNVIITGGSITYTNNVPETITFNMKLSGV